MIDPLPISREKEAVLSRTRPSWLPPKDPAEEKKHIKEYQKMIAKSLEADKKREAARKEKEESKDKTANTLMRIWEDDILKNWDHAIEQRRTRELWWKGIAPRSRGVVWHRAIGNQLELTETSFQAALARSHEVDKRVASGKASIEDERRMEWFTQIKTDAEEHTWLDLKIFQAGGPLHQSLVDVLRAYSMYRSDIGYVTGCHTIAALLLLNLPTAADTFVALANILNRPLPLSFYASDPGAQASACSLVHRALATRSPRLHQHLSNRELDLNLDRFIADMFTTLFTQHLGLDECSRLMDVYVFEGDAILINAAVALLMRHEMGLLAAPTEVEVRKVLENSTQGDLLPRGQEDEWMARVRESGRA